MPYRINPLVISIDKMQQILDYAKKRAATDGMSNFLNIQQINGEITITQDKADNIPENPFFRMKL